MYMPFSMAFLLLINYLLKKIKISSWLIVHGVFANDLEWNLKVNRYTHFLIIFVFLVLNIDELYSMCKYT